MRNMFHSFANQNERRRFGGSAFLELQYCKLNKGTSLDIVVSVNSINHWQDDSIYVFEEDFSDFLINYGDIFDNGLYNNMNRGKIDFYGINYYSPLQIIEIINDIEEKKTVDYAMILNWLKEAKQYNGIYILGI